MTDTSGAANHDCMCSAANASAIDFTKAYMGQNNLGGAGPDTGVQEMRYINIFGQPFPIRWKHRQELCIDVVGGEVKQGANIATHDCVDDGTHRNMQWTLPSSGTGLIRWTPNPGFCLDVQGGSTLDAANVYLYPCDASNPNQQWILPAGGEGEIKWATYPDRCMNVHGGTADTSPSPPGRINIDVYKCNGNADQQFVLPLVSESTDLVLTTLNTYDGGDGNGNVPAQMENGFGALKIRWGTATDVQFQFVESGTSTPRVISEAHMAFFDLDGQAAWQEYLSGEGYKGYITDIAPTLSANMLSSGRTQFEGTVSVANPTEPGVATDAQRKASVMFFFKDTSTFTVTFGHKGNAAPYTSPGQFATFFFSGSSVLVDRCGP